jgi:putative ABC transport system permease protein
VDDGFIDGGRIPLAARAVGIGSDEEAWQLLKTRSHVAIVDNFTVSGGGFGFDGQTFHIDGIDPEADEFEPVRLSIRDPIAGTRAEVEVIGVIDFGASANFFGIYVPEETFRQALGEPLLTHHLVGLNDPGHAKRVAREIEATLLPLGAQAESIKQRVDEGQAMSRNFFRLMQGFMGLGLFVGIAAVGVISFRTVVERRQHIGMLRAIGYKRGMVALSFLLESSFIALLGILSGVSLAIWLSYFLLTSDEFPSQEAGYVVPWGQIAFIGGLAFLASLLMTYVPSRQAASVPIAEALRYE